MASSPLPPPHQVPLGSGALIPRHPFPLGSGVPGPLDPFSSGSRAPPPPHSFSFGNGAPLPPYTFQSSSRATPQSAFRPPCGSTEPAPANLRPPFFRDPTQLPVWSKDPSHPPHPPWNPAAMQFMANPNPSFPWAVPMPHKLQHPVGLEGAPHNAGMMQCFSFQSLLHGVGMAPAIPHGLDNDFEEEATLNDPDVHMDYTGDDECGSDDGNFVDGTESLDVGSEESEDEELSDGEASDDELSEEYEIEGVDELSDGDAQDVVDGTEVSYEFATTTLGDCGCSSNNTAYKKRKRWRKGETPPDCRQPRDMGAIEKAFRNAPKRNTEHIFEPIIGMVFDSKEEAYQFYNLYSWEVGFGVRFGSSSESKVTKYRTMQEIVCEKEGFDSRCTNSSKRNKCKAMLRLHRTEDHGWYVSHHVKQHNHLLSVSCGEKREWNSHGRIEQCTMDMIRYLRENNVTLSRVHCIMGSMFGGMENIPFNQKTLRGVCKRIARDQKDDDWLKTLEHFKKMRVEDPGFNFAADFDNDGKVKSLLWTSGKSRSDYNFFGDVITFDTTYCTNLYKMPFGIFVGVNNHFQSTLFAGVLMRDETAKSFEWVFKQFLALMGGKTPITILTDQCKAMTKAIKNIMPDSNHLWCKWHVLKDAPQELGPLYSVKSSFRKEFEYVVNEMLTVDEFERAWAHLLKTYKLKNHPFLKKAYKKRKKWAKAWSKGKFCARMTSTQRSESSNSMLKKVVPRNSSMNKFVEQYQKLLFIRTSAEHKAEYKTKLFADRHKRVEPVEKHAFAVYTYKAFQLFREETNKCTDYNVLQGATSDEFRVIHNNADKRKKWARAEYNVTVDRDSNRYCCECGLFEHFGMLCCHAIKVLIHCGVNKIPEAHILKRWTRDARDIVYPEVGTSATEQVMKSLMYVHALETVRCAGTDHGAREIVMKHLKSAKKEVELYFDAKRKEQGYMSSTGVTDDEGFFTDTDIGADGASNSYGGTGPCAHLSDAELESMQLPPVVRKKGRPKCNRYKMRSEIHTSKSNNNGKEKATRSGAQKQASVNRKRKDGK